MSVTEVFAGVRGRDRGAAIDYYQRLLGAAPTMFPNDDEAGSSPTPAGCTSCATLTGQVAHW